MRLDYLLDDLKKAIHTKNKRYIEKAYQRLETKGFDRTTARILALSN